MNRNEAIAIIKNTFPPETEVGMDLLAQAKAETTRLETEPTPVLIRYANLCKKNCKIDKSKERVVKRIHDSIKNYQRRI